MKKSAVEWLSNELYEKFEMKGDGALFNDLLNQANRIFTEQIEDAFDSGWKRADTTRDIPYSTAEDFGNNYYNQTFGTPTPWYDEDQTVARMNVIGQNGNEGEHYNK